MDKQDDSTPTNNAVNTNFVAMKRSFAQVTNTEAPNLNNEENKAADSKSGTNLLTEKRLKTDAEP